MKIDSFTISEVMFLLDIVKEDKVRWLKTGNDSDVINEYKSIISKLEFRLEEYHGLRRAMNHLVKLSPKQTRE